MWISGLKGFRGEFNIIAFFMSKKNCLFLNQGSSAIEINSTVPCFAFLSAYLNILGFVNLNRMFGRNGIPILHCNIGKIKQPLLAGSCQSRTKRKHFFKPKPWVPLVMLCIVWMPCNIVVFGGGGAVTILILWLSSVYNMVTEVGQFLYILIGLRLTAVLPARFYLGYSLSLCASSPFGEYCRKLCEHHMKGNA